MKNIFVAIGLSALSWLLTGCPDQPEPTPADTVLSDPSRPAGYQGQDASGTYGNEPYGQQDRLDPANVTLDDGLQQRAGGAGAVLLEGDEQVLESVYFGFDEFSIRPAERAKLEEAATYLQNNPNTRLIAEGHTSWRGTEAYNLGLGERRANAVRNYLQAAGVDAARIETSSKGELEADQDIEDKQDPDVVDDRRVDLLLQE